MFFSVAICSFSLSLFLVSIIVRSVSTKNTYLFSLSRESLRFAHANFHSKNSLKKQHEHY